MLEGWRLKLREAQLAVAGDRLEEAAKLLYSDELRSIRRARDLTLQVAHRLIQKTYQPTQPFDRRAAWRHLDLARALAGESPEYLEARNELVVSIFEEMERKLGQGDYTTVLNDVEDLERHHVAGTTIARFREAAQRMDAARRLAALGRFPDAELQVGPIKELVAECATMVDQLQAEYRVKSERYHQLQVNLRRHMQSDDWKQAGSLADELCSMTPANAELRQVRREVRAKMEQMPPAQPLGDLDATTTPARESRETLGSGGDSPDRVQRPRFLLWVDAVGGFLVSLSDEVLIGQAVPGNAIDVPIQADLSRRHAKIVRQGGDYIVEALQPIRIEGKVVEGRTLLSDGDEIELGGVRLRFRQPHALSSTARLDFVSRHRSQPSADAVLLMAESCVLGPAWRNHVVCRDWSHDVVILRQDNQLYCRTVDSMEIDGQTVMGRGRLTRNSRVVGNDFSMALEELDKWTN